jgi:hypothetical protein
VGRPRRRRPVRPLGESRRDSSWFRGALSRHEARIRVGGVEKDVALVESEAANDEVDDAYHAKYDLGYPSIVPRIVAPEPRAATLRLVPS